MSDDGSDDVLSRNRENNHAERVRKRREMYNQQRRLAAEESNCDFSEDMEFSDEDIISAADILRFGGTSTVKEKSFSLLKNAFLLDPCHMVSFMKVEGALHALVGYLMSKDPYEQLLAAETCSNLSLGDSKTCYKLAKKAAPYIITILNGLNYGLMSVCLQCIVNLSGSGSQTCQLLHSQGILNALERTMTIPELREPTMKALIIFIKNGASHISKDEVTCLLLIILPHFELSDKVQWLVYLLSSLPYVIPILIENDIPMRVMTLLSSIRRLRNENLISVTSLVRTLGNLSADPGGVTACLMLDRWETTVIIIKFFLESKYKHLCKEVYWSLGNILQHQHPSVQNKLTGRTHDFSWLGCRISIPST